MYKYAAYVVLLINVAHSTAQNALESPLLRLRAEIRVQIYELVIPVLLYDVEKIGGPHGNELIALRFLCTSRQINQDAAYLSFERSVFYPCNLSRLDLLT